MRSLGVVCARAGSKGLPGKNIMPFNGEPLILRSVKTALKSNLTDVVVSTDCEYVEKLVGDLAAVIKRPPHLALDTSPIHEAVLHALEWMQDRTYDAVVCLQNSQPFRIAEDIDRSLEVLEARPEIDTVMSVASYGHAHPRLAYRITADDKATPMFEVSSAYRRQDDAPAFFMSGIVFTMRCSVFQESPHVPCGTIAPLEIPPHRAMDIHDWRDWRIAEAIEGVINGRDMA